MAELNPSISNSSKSRRGLKSLPKVDLTAMVDLGIPLNHVFYAYNLLNILEKVATNSIR